MLFSASQQKPIARSTRAASFPKVLTAIVQGQARSSKATTNSKRCTCLCWSSPLFLRRRSFTARTRKAHQAACSASPWDALGVDPQADEQQIRRAYRKLALKHHPDTNSSPEAHRTFVDIHEAYQVLMGRRRGKEDSEQPRAKGGWDFHDWYWNFMTAQRQKSKSGAAARPTTALRTEHLDSQLLGLKRKAAARRMRAQSKPFPNSWSTPVEEQPANITPAASGDPPQSPSSSSSWSSPVEEQPSTVSPASPGVPPTVTNAHVPHKPAASMSAAPAASGDPFTVTNAHVPHKPAASMSATARARLREEAGVEAIGEASPGNGFSGEESQLAGVEQPMDRPLHTGHVMHCVQELLNHAWRSNAVTFTVKSWPTQGFTDYSPQASVSPQAAAPSRVRQGSMAATVELPSAQTLSRESRNASGRGDVVAEKQGIDEGSWRGQGDVAADKQGIVEGSWRGQGDVAAEKQDIDEGSWRGEDEPHQQARMAAEFTAPSEVQSQLAGLKRRAALRVKANI